MCILTLTVLEPSWFKKATFPTRETRSLHLVVSHNRGVPRQWGGFNLHLLQPALYQFDVALWWQPQPASSLGWLQLPVLTLRKQTKKQQQRNLDKKHHPMEKKNQVAEITSPREILQGLGTHRFLPGWSQLFPMCSSKPCLNWDAWFTN